MYKIPPGSLPRKNRIHVFTLCLLLAATIFLQAPACHAAARDTSALTSKQLKLLKGKWEKGSSAFFDYYYTFTKKYCRQHNLKTGKIISKDKIISVKKSGKTYTLHMKGKGYTYRYTGTMKNGTIKTLSYCWKEDGVMHTSGGSSLFRDRDNP